MPAPLLTDAEISSRLPGLPAWQLSDGRLTRTVTTRDFRSAVELIARIAVPADEQQHHPDVEIHWNLVTLTLWTHASGGVTECDFRLADAIEPILTSPER